MTESNVVEISGREGITDPLTELLRTGARKLIERAVEMELEDYVAKYSMRRTADGKAGVVRNGYLPARQLQTGPSLGIPPTPPEQRPSLHSIFPLNTTPRYRRL